MFIPTTKFLCISALGLEIIISSFHLAQAVAIKYAWLVGFPDHQLLCGYRRLFSSWLQLSASQQCWQRLCFLKCTWPPHQRHRCIEGVTTHHAMASLVNMFHFVSPRAWVHTDRTLMSVNTVFTKCHVKKMEAVPNLLVLFHKRMALFSWTEELLATRKKKRFYVVKGGYEWGWAQAKPGLMTNCLASADVEIHKGSGASCWI